MSGVYRKVEFSLEMKGRIWGGGGGGMGCGAEGRPFTAACRKRGAVLLAVSLKEKACASKASQTKKSVLKIQDLVVKEFVN